MQLKIYLLSFVSVLFSASAFGQATASTDNSFESLPEGGGDDWTFYLDQENKVYYIDFESISVNLSDLRVKNAQGDLVMQDNLGQLPVNTIYELDLKSMKPGKYSVELRTYTEVIRKEVTVE